MTGWIRWDPDSCSPISQDQLDEIAKKLDEKFPNLHHNVNDFVNQEVYIEFRRLLGFEDSWTLDESSFDKYVDVNE